MSQKCWCGKWAFDAGLCKDHFSASKHSAPPDKAAGASSIHSHTVAPLKITAADPYVVGGAAKSPSPTLPPPSPASSSAAVNIHLRSSLVAQEPLKFRSPIYGLFRGLTPPDQDSNLADALAPLIKAIASGQVPDLTVQDMQIAIIHCHNNGVDVKQFQESGHPSPLTAAGIAAINLYTGEFVPPHFYSVLNTALRDANREKCKPFVPYIWLLMHALRDCPLYSKRVVFRGVKADLSSQYPKDREVTWFQFSSCTCDLSVEQSDQFCGSKGVRTLFTIELTTCRARLVTKYSLVPSEAEVLLPPNCRFKVKGSFNTGNGLIQIQLEELPCLDPILDFDPPSPAATLLPVPHFPAPIPASFPAVAGGGSAAATDDADDELQSLVCEMLQLKVGLKKSCVVFARSLALAGVMSLEELRPLPTTKARGLLEKSGMQEMQVEKVIAAYNVKKIVTMHPTRMMSLTSGREVALDSLEHQMNSAPEALAPVPAPAFAAASAATADPTGLGRYGAPGKHVRHNGYIYATAHVHNFDCRHKILDDHALVDVDAGFEIAPGDARDIEVANAHAWGSYWLVFSDGAISVSALGIDDIPPRQGVKFAGSFLLRDGARVAAKGAWDDVLVRKRA